MWETIWQEGGGVYLYYSCQQEEELNGWSRARIKHSGSARILPPFCPSVLKPGLDLCVRHLQGLGQGGALGWRQVLLPVKPFLQLADLHPTERGARLFPLGRRTVLVRVADATGHGEGREGSCNRKFTFECIGQKGTFLASVTMRLNKSIVFGLSGLRLMLVSSHFHEPGGIDASEVETYFPGGSAFIPSTQVLFFRSSVG